MTAPAPWGLTKFMLSAAAIAFLVFMAIMGGVAAIDLLLPGERP